MSKNKHVKTSRDYVSWPGKSAELKRTAWNVYVFIIKNRNAD